MNSALWKGTDRGAPISAHVTTLSDENFTKMVQLLAGLENMQQYESEGLPLVLIIIIKKYFSHCATFMQLQVAYSSPYKEEQKSDPLKNHTYFCSCAAQRNRETPYLFSTTFVH